MDAGERDRTLGKTNSDDTDLDELLMMDTIDFTQKIAGKFSTKDHNHLPASTYNLMDAVDILCRKKLLLAVRIVDSSSYPIKTGGCLPAQYRLM